MVRSDERPWLEIADQVNNGYYAQADSSTIQSLIYGLHRIQHPNCQEAAKRLEKVLPKAIARRKTYNL